LAFTSTLPPSEPCTATIHGAVAPGAAGVPAIGHLQSSGSLTFAPGSDYGVEIGNWAGTVPGTDWDHLTVDALVFTATPADKLVIHVSGTPSALPKPTRPSPSPPPSNR
jgi:hypothetical protein